MELDFYVDEKNLDSGIMSQITTPFVSSLELQGSELKSSKSLGRIALRHF